MLTLSSTQLLTNILLYSQTSFFSCQNFVCRSDILLSLALASSVCLLIKPSIFCIRVSHCLSLCCYSFYKVDSWSIIQIYCMRISPTSCFEFSKPSLMCVSMCFINWMLSKDDWTSSYTLSAIQRQRQSLNLLFLGANKIKSDKILVCIIKAFRSAFSRTLS